MTKMLININKYIKYILKYISEHFLNQSKLFTFYPWFVNFFLDFFKMQLKLSFSESHHSGFWLDFPQEYHMLNVCFRASLCRVFWLCWGTWRTDTTSSSCRASPVKTTCGWGAHPLHLTDISSLYTLRNMSNILSFSLSQDFLLHIFTVFRILIRPEMFPKDWTVMRLVTNKFETLFPCSCTWCGFQSIHCDLKCLIYSIIITTVLYLSDALRKNFLNDKFDYKVCSQSVCYETSVDHCFLWRSL